MEHEVEDLAVRWGVRIAKARGYHNIVVESDCLSIINALKQEATRTGYLFLIIKTTFYY